MRWVTFLIGPFLSKSASLVRRYEPPEIRFGINFNPKRVRVKEFSETRFDVNRKTKTKRKVVSENGRQF